MINNMGNDLVNLEWLDQIKKNPLTANVSGRVLVSCGAIGRKTGGLSKADFNRDGGVRQ